MHPILHLIMSSNMPLRDIASLSVAELKSIAQQFTGAANELDEVIQSKSSKEALIGEEGIYWIFNEDAPLPEHEYSLTRGVYGFYRSGDSIIAETIQLVWQPGETTLHKHCYSRVETDIQHINDIVDSFSNRPQIDKKTFIELSKELNRVYDQVISSTNLLFDNLYYLMEKHDK